MNTARTLAAAAWLSLLAAACGGGTGNDTGTTTGTTAATATSSDTGAEDSAAPTTTAAICVERCDVDSDCLLDGEDHYRCLDGVCVHASVVMCEQDSECLVDFSNAGHCSVQADCGESPLTCVDLGDGVGSCVWDANVLECTEYGWIEVKYPRFEGGAPAAVCITVAGCNTTTHSCETRCISDAQCGSLRCNLVTKKCDCTADEHCQVPMFKPTAVCDAGRCGCGTDADCWEPLKPRCIPGSGGECGCGTDADCPQWSPRCLPDGSCGCASGEDCEAEFSGDTCVDGLCRCSANTACAAQFDNTKIACEPL